MHQTGACAAYTAGAANVAVATRTAAVPNGTAVARGWIGRANMSTTMCVLTSRSPRTWRDREILRRHHQCSSRAYRKLRGLIQIEAGCQQDVSERNQINSFMAVVRLETYTDSTAWVATSMAGIIHCVRCWRKRSVPSDRCRCSVHTWRRLYVLTDRYQCEAHSKTVESNDCKRSGTPVSRSSESRRNAPDWRLCGVHCGCRQRRGRQKKCSRGKRHSCCEGLDRKSKHVHHDVCVDFQIATYMAGP